MEIDKDIWLRIAANDEEAYEKMYVYYYRSFYIYAQKFSTDFALIEDSIQEIMISIWHNRSGLPQVNYPAAYFFTSLRNLLIHKLKASEMILSDDYIVEDVDSSPEHSVINRETNAETKRQLDKASGYLTARQNEAIFLRFYQELSYEEVAEIMGITVKATYKIMARALQELKKKYPTSVLLVLLSFFK